MVSMGVDLISRVVTMGRMHTKVQHTDVLESDNASQRDQMIDYSPGMHEIYVVGVQA